MFTLYTADCQGDPKNTHYPHKQVIRNEADLRAAVRMDHVCAAYKDSKRGNKNFVFSDCIVMDCDNEGSEDESEWITKDFLAEEFGAYDAAIVESRNSMKQKGDKKPRPKFHLYFRTKKIISAEEYQKIKKQLYIRYPFFDANALDAGRFIFGCETRGITWLEGGRSIEEKFKNGIPEGRRNATLSRFAGRVVKRYGYTDEARRIFEEEAEKCDPPLEEKEIDNIWHSAGNFFKKIEASTGYVPPEKYNEPAGSLKPDDYSDVGQAKVLAREYGEELRFNPSTDFLRYDGVSWAESREEATGAAVELTDLELVDAKKMLAEKVAKLEELGTSPEEMKKYKGSEEEIIKAYEEFLEAKGYYNFVMQRRNWKYIKAALDTCKPMVAIDLRDLDADPFLLNTPSATYNLKTGEMREHRAEDYITKTTDVDPGDKGKELWLETLQKIFCGDDALIEYVQEVVGMAAVGRVFFEALIIAYGDGRNGKSTFWNTVSKAMGSYAGRLSADTLTVGCKRNVKPELAETFGKRIIIAAELEEGTRLNTSVVKQLCSTDDIYAEKKYKAPFFFTPSHTVILYTNHLPRVSALDRGTWRRLLIIPFNAVFEGKNDVKNFGNVLYENAAPAVMQWIIEGAGKVIKKNFKLEAPEIVMEAVRKYREDNDWLQQYLEDCCEVGEGLEEKSGALYEDYRSYCLRMNEYSRSTTDFYGALDSAGFFRHKTRKGAFVKGLRIKTGF